MDPVITGISAWQYWTTPPVIGEVDLPEGIAFAPHPNGVGLRPELRCDRGNVFCQLDLSKMSTGI